MTPNRTTFRLPVAIDPMFDPERDERLITCHDGTTVCRITPQEAVDGFGCEEPTE